MKNFKNILIGMTTAALLGSCQGDLLDLNPYGSVGSGTMWSTENLADQGVTGIYNVLRKGKSSSSDDPAYVGLGLYVFDCFGVTADCRDRDYALLSGNATTSNTLFSDYWKDHYEGIHRANDAIANLPKTEMADSKKGRLIAESKFLRAFFYYKLNMVYKGVPLYLTPIELEECIQGRETEAKIWEAVITDLTDCINEANLPDRYLKGDASFGRVTKAAAYALRGKAYMWTKDFPKAEADLKEVGRLGHQLFDGDYKQLFKEANEQSDEMIFSVQCIGIEKYGNDISFRFGSRATQDGGGWDTYFPSNDFVESYQWADGKPFNWDDVIPGYNAMDPKKRSVYFLRDNMTAAQIKSMTENQGADMDKYLPTGNEARIRQAYTNRDSRLEASIITPFAKFLGTDGVEDQIYVLRWPYDTNVKPVFDIKTDTPSAHHYLFRKFVAEGGNEIPNRKYSPIDFPLIRYADVLLNLAEALNEQGGAEKMREAIECVNLVRDRAKVAKLNSNSYTTVAGQDDLRERIRQERRWEFNGEGVNFFDELRWGSWKDTKFHEGAGLKQVWGQTDYTYSFGGDQYYTWPIPNAEKAMNDNLDQTLGWID